ncbi:MAG: Rv1355c family protein [Myxococcota bacterium]|nr:Rv1355c family protein [Myxococcota bacterium]
MAFEAKHDIEAPSRYPRHESRPSPLPSIDLSPQPGARAQSRSLPGSLTCKPSLLCPRDPSDAAEVERLRQDPTVEVFDRLEDQLSELIRLRHPNRELSGSELGSLLRGHLGGEDVARYGIWFFYPWSRRLVKLLPEQEFAEVRTVRNRYKLTDEQQTYLGTRRVGLVGLSVGKSVALALALERSFGELRIADHDSLELCNLNRISAGVHDLGLSKAVLVAREIAELDPYLEVSLFPDGLTRENLDAFFDGGAPIHCLIEECDGLDMKVLARRKAREMEIPVIMEMNDRCTLDVERFDLEPARPLLHGLIKDIDPDQLSGLSTEEKIPFVLPMLGEATISVALKASMLEIDESLSGWPQLGSSVVMGGGVVADTYRRVMLDEFRDSGRWFVDLEALVAGDSPPAPPPDLERGGFSAETTTADELAAQLRPTDRGEPLRPMSTETALDLVRAGTSAPSGANAQPWRWLHHRKQLWLYLDRARAGSFLDFASMGSMMALGAAAEAAVVGAAGLGQFLEVEYLGEGEDAAPVARLGLECGTPDAKAAEQASLLGQRATNRATSGRERLPPSTLDALGAFAETIGARASTIADPDTLDAWAPLFADIDRRRFLGRRTHREFFHEELRWTEEQAERTGDGVDLRTVDLSPSKAAGLRMASDYRVVEQLQRWGRGRGLGRIAEDSLRSASALWIMQVDAFDAEHLFEAGRHLQRFWLEACALDVAVHPMTAPACYWARARYDEGGSFSSEERQELLEQRKEFCAGAGLEPEADVIFIAKLSPGHSPGIRSVRRPLTDVFFSRSN